MATRNDTNREPENRTNTPGTNSDFRSSQGTTEVRKTDEALRGAGWNRGFETMGSEQVRSADANGAYYRAAMQRSQQQRQAQSQRTAATGYTASNLGPNYRQNYGPNDGSQQQNPGGSSGHGNRGMYAEGERDRAYTGAEGSGYGYGAQGERHWGERNWNERTGMDRGYGQQNQGERAEWNRESNPDWNRGEHRGFLSNLFGRQETREAGRRGRWQRDAVTAREIMTRNVRGVRRNALLRDVAQIMKDENCGIVPVLDESNRLIGVVTDRDIVMRAMLENRNPQEMRVEEVMTADVEAVHADERVIDIIEMMGERQIRRIPVVDRNDQLMGIIAMADIATRADTDEDLQEALEKISSRRTFWSRLFT